MPADTSYAMQHRIPQGFTLVEALIVALIAAMLLAMAAPSYRDFTKNNVMITQINHFNNILQYSRSQSVRDRTNVTICTSDNQATCAAHDNWESGWIIFTTNPDTTLNILKIGENISDRNITLRATGFADAGRIDYTPKGILANDDSRGTFTLCDERGTKNAKAIIINAVGRTQRAFDQNGNGIVEDNRAAEVTCT